MGLGADVPAPPALLAGDALRLAAVFIGRTAASNKTPSAPAEPWQLWRGRDDSQDGFLNPRPGRASASRRPEGRRAGPADK